MANALDSKWSQLTEEQKAEYGSKGDFRAAKENRMAGDAVKAYRKSDSDYLDLGKLNVQPKAVTQEGIDARAAKIESLTAAGGNEDKIAKLTAKNERQGRKLEAQQAFDSSDINSYDTSAYGGSRFGKRDIAFLESQGFSKQEISDYANKLDKSQIHGSAQVLDGYDIHRDGMINEDGSFNASQMGVRADHFNKKDLRGMAASGMDEREMARAMYDQMDDTTRAKGAQKLLDRYIDEFRSEDADSGSETGTETDTETGETTGNISIDNSDNSTVVGGTGNNSGSGGTVSVGDSEQGSDVIGGGAGGATVVNSGNTTINDSFNGGTIDISGDITAGGNVGIDNSNNAAYYGSDTNNSATNSGIQYGGSSEQQAQDMLQNSINAITGNAGVSNSGNTGIDNSFNGGNVDISGDITAGGDVNVDNSNNSRYFGGDSTNIAINYGDGRTNYSPMSDLTMMGYGKPSSSPAAQAKFVDFYQTLNQDSQKKYKNTGTDTANKYIQNAAATNPIDYVALNSQISQSIQNHYDNAAIQESIYMGDKYNYRPPTYQMPDPLERIESDAADIAEDYKEDLENID